MAAAGQRQRGPGHEPPVRAEVEHELLVLVEELSVERHDGEASSAQPQPSSWRRRSSMPKWWATSWTTVMVTCSTTCSSVAHSSQMFSRKMVMRSG